jgi:hypothetical protein
MPNCKSCGAEIIWAVNEATGKKIPLSVKSKERRFILLDGESNVRLVETCLTHFADCPQAEQHRKSRVVKGE